MTSFHSHAKSVSETFVPPKRWKLFRLSIVFSKVYGLKLLQTTERFKGCDLSCGRSEATQQPLTEADSNS